MTLSDLPNSRSVVVDGNTLDLADGELEAEMPASYLFELIQWPYISRAMKMTVNEA
ncbi:hypothetical protein [Rhizobium leguminosarum]|uniref:hypothetical protein n=1 Tax=Rhizobium leguminosarum TaxID=384 RepID=UPI003F9D0CCE